MKLSNYTLYRKCHLKKIRLLEGTKMKKKRFSLSSSKLEKKKKNPVQSKSKAFFKFSKTSCTHLNYSKFVFLCFDIQIFIANL